jgi:hydroxypyruvate reductase
METINWKIPGNIPNEHRESILRIIKSSLEAVDPYFAVKKSIQSEENGFSIDGKHYSINQNGKIKVVAIGKASISMTRGLLEVLGEKIHSGLVVTKKFSDEPIDNTERFNIISGSHPVPDEKSIIAAETVIDYLKDTKEEDIVIFLISGGGSALLTEPEDGLKLAHLQKVTQLLLASGANIQEMNVIRKHLDRVKGGKLAVAASPARFISLIISDVTDNALDSIASGPTVPDLSIFNDAIHILKRYQLWEIVPDEVRNFLMEGKKGYHLDTVKSSDAVWEKGSIQIIANNATAMHAAYQQAMIEGYAAYAEKEPFIGEAQEVGSNLVCRARELWKAHLQSTKNACILFGGETTVTLKGNGKGGRNQETALSAAKLLSDSKEEIFITLATDGEDGPTDAAGAIVNGTTLKDAKKLHLDIDEALITNNTYPLLEKMDLLLKTGSTGTNVNDLAFWFTLK